MIVLDSIPLPDNTFWYSIAIALFIIMAWIIKWWTSRVESRQDASDTKFNVFLTEISEMRQTQALQNQVLEKHSKYIESEESNIKVMTQTLLETLQYLTGSSEKDELNPTVQRFRNRK